VTLLVKEKLTALRHCFNKRVISGKLLSGKLLENLPFVWFCKVTNCDPETLVEGKSKVECMDCSNAKIVSMAYLEAGQYASAASSPLLLCTRHPNRR